MSNQKAQEAYLRETKRLMRSKLADYGVAITDSTPFRAYVGGIDLAVANATPPPTEPDEAVDELRKKIRLMVSSETLDTLALTAEDFEGVDVIRRYALYNHPALTSVEIHPDVLSIDPNAFYGCAKLETVRLPKKIKLQSNCFANCTALKRVYLPVVTTSEEIPQFITGSVFPLKSAAPDMRFIVPDQTSKDLYLKNPMWSASYGDIIYLPEEVTEL